MKKVLAITISTLFLFGCASAPKAVKDEATKTLYGSCLDLFLSSMYQMKIVETVFALAYDTKDNQACGYAWITELYDGKDCVFDCKEKTTSAEVDAMAIGRCEDYKKRIGSNVKAQCKVFARNNDIVWGKEDASAIDFE